ncbi:MAG: SMI1/KNR4 family protein [Actinobacteria bacterium]|nr:SMI1/KNR4 family protein [Actinomycetota bacterium]
MGDLTPALLYALRKRADDPHRFIDMPEFSEFRRFPPAKHAQIDRASAQLGFPFPVDLRTLLVEVANGGFGPGYGLLGVDSGATDDSGANVERAYGLLSAPDPEVPDWVWREGALPCCYWGCQVYSCVMPDGSVVQLDGYDWGREAVPIAKWLSLWVDDRLHVS